MHLYSVLNVSPAATRAQIHEAYVAACARFSAEPKGLLRRVRWRWRIRDVERAYRVLSLSASRAAYDDQIRQNAYINGNTMLPP